LLPGAFAAAGDCPTTWIKSAAGLDDLRQRCRVIHGHLLVGPFADNSTDQHINLDGIEEIEGTLGEHPSDQRNITAQPYYTLSSSSLEKVGGIDFGSSWSRLVNLTLPKLTSVGGRFEVGSNALDLTYLDITGLDSAYQFYLAAPNITTLRHTRLQNVTFMDINSMKIASLNSLSDNQLNLTRASIKGPFPNVKSIVIGFKSADSLSVNAQANVTLGGSATREMTIGKFDLAGITDLKRSEQVQTLKVDSVTIGSDIRIDQLEIPFDDLRYLGVEQIWQTHPLKGMTLPPAAVNWTGGFELMIYNSPSLNLTSVYGTDKQGNTIKTWYWPRNISSIQIGDVTVSNGFLYVSPNLQPCDPTKAYQMNSDDFVAQQNGSLGKGFAPSVLEGFTVAPSRNSTDFTCVPFLELQKIGCLPNGTNHNFFCANSTRTSGASPLHASSPIGLLGAVIGLGVWTLALNLS
jgi:hypothetical protein